jgi:predicted O-linked N-acetylglucosamine transferase (SPINDLY family)/glycosyltransferase involved in cell wall biosynthesis
MNSIEIVHVIQHLCGGGASRSLLATAKCISKLGHFSHRIISLLPPDPQAVEAAKKVGIKDIISGDRSAIIDALNSADLVKVHFWNNPELYDFLRSDLPPMRLLFWFHVSGDRPPQIIPKEAIDFCDFALASSPYTYQLPIFQNLPETVRFEKTGMVYDSTDFDRLAGFNPQPHDTFNVGYIGMVSFEKMHPNYISMSAKIEIPTVRFIVCGNGIQQYLQQQAEKLGVASRFEFRGYVENIRSVLEVLDIFGYPLCEENYSTAELVLQEALFAGIPPVIFAYGGAQCSVIDNYTGFVVRSELEYKQAIEFLYHHPTERERLARNAREYARQIFGAENAAKKLEKIYQKLLNAPKQSRHWGIPRGSSLLEQPLSLNDVSGGLHKYAGSRYFIEALGETAPQFLTSMNSDNLEELLESDRQIAESSDLLSSIGSGGILHYRNHYHKDAFLRFWSALLLQQRGRYDRAIAEFSAAIALGFTHWRVHWYLAQLAAKTNDFSLARQALQKVSETVPDFNPARELLSRLQENTPVSPSSSASVSTQISRPHQIAQSIANLSNNRYQLAQQWLSLPGDRLEIAYQGELGKLQRSLLQNGIQYQPIAESEYSFVERLRNQITPGFTHPKAIQSLLAFMLYQRADRLASGWYEGAPIPKWLFQDFLNYLIAAPEVFLDIGEAESYYHYWQDLVNYLHDKILSNPEVSIWQEVAQLFAQKANFVPAYFTRENLRSLYSQRAEILAFSLQNKGCQLDYEFPSRPDRKRLRLGIIKEHFQPQTETYLALPIFEDLNREEFEVILYAFDISGAPLERYCQQHCDRLVKLPQELQKQVQTIRTDELDLVWFASNLTAINKPIVHLALHRLARVQVTSLASPTTTGMTSIDYYIAGHLTAPLPAFRQQYREELITLEGSGLCFSFPLPKTSPTVRPTRQSLGITDEDIVFISGANFYKIIPELRETWAKILADVPHSKLILYPFNPNWEPSYPAQPFVRDLYQVLARYGVDRDRLIFLKTLPTIADIQVSLSVADIYLDSYPYSGATSLLDPFQLALPVVAMDGETLRGKQASALLREVGMNELIATNESEYIELAIRLANHRELRQQYRDRIWEKMQATPPFLDRKNFGQKVGQLLHKLWQKQFAGVNDSTSELGVGQTQAVTTDANEVPTQKFLNRLLGCANLYYIDPSDRNIVAELHEIRRQMAEFWLNTPADLIEGFYKGNVGQGYKTLVESEFKHEQLTPEESEFCDRLLQVVQQGFNTPNALNYLLALKLYREVNLSEWSRGSQLPQWLF